MWLLGVGMQSSQKIVWISCIRLLRFNLLIDHLRKGYRLKIDCTNNIRIEEQAPPNNIVIKFGTIGTL